MTAATESDLREIEEAITLYRLAVCNDLQNITHERVAARAALLAAVGKEIAATRAERDALAALVKVARCPNNNCEDGIIPWVRGGVLETEPCQWCDERAKALRAPQTGGANDGQT